MNREKKSKIYTESVYFSAYHSKSLLDLICRNTSTSNNSAAFTSFSLSSLHLHVGDVCSEIETKLATCSFDHCGCSSDRLCLWNAEYFLKYSMNCRTVAERSELTGATMINAFFFFLGSTWKQSGASYLREILFVLQKIIDVTKPMAIGLWFACKIQILGNLKSTKLHTKLGNFSFFILIYHHISLAYYSSLHRVPIALTIHIAHGIHRCNDEKRFSEVFVSYNNNCNFNRYYKPFVSLCMISLFRHCFN